MIHPPAIPSGLRAVPAVASAISLIQAPEDRLFYRGIPIDELVEHGTFEETVHLLWFARLPTRPELIAFKEQIAAAAPLPSGLLDLMHSFPRRTTPMEALRTAVSCLAMYDPESEDMSPAANRRKAVRLLGQTAALVAAHDRLRNDRPPVPPRPDLSLAANFLYMLRGLMPDPLAVRALDKAYILHADHELNASTFAARVTASTASDLHSCILAAIAALKGPLHGGANMDVMRMLNEIARPEAVETHIRNKLAQQERIPGFGHAVYKTDPRAAHLREISRQLGKLTAQEHWYEMSVRIDELVSQSTGLKPNIDFYSASIYHYLNIPPDLFTALFAIARTAGWTAHILEQYADHHLLRPRAHYTGPTPTQHWTPIDRREEAPRPTPPGAPHGPAG